MSARTCGGPASEGTRGFFVTCYDPDAPTAAVLALGIGRLAATTTELPRGAGSPGGELPPAPSTYAATTAKTRTAVPPPSGDVCTGTVFAVHRLDTDDLGLNRRSAPRRRPSTSPFHTLARATYEPLTRSPDRAPRCRDCLSRSRDSRSRGHPALFPPCWLALFAVERRVDEPLRSSAGWASVRHGQSTGNLAAIARGGRRRKSSTSEQRDAEYP